MSEAGETFPNWNKPASIGDVLQAMIWAQSVHTALANLLFAIESGDQAQIARAKIKLGEERDDYRVRLDHIAGRVRP